jgi:hypothetical protein
MPCVFSEEEIDYKISVLEMQSWLVYTPMLLYFLCESKLLNHHPITVWEKEHL